MTQLGGRAGDAALYEQQGFGGHLELSGRVALLIVDFVNGFADPRVLGGGNIAEAIRATCPVLQAFRSHQLPIAYSRIVFADDGSDGNVFSGKIGALLQLTERSPLSAVADALKPAPGELIVRKTVPSAFHGTPLGPWLTERGVRTVFVAGATTSGCVRASVVDALSFGFRPFVLSDCVGDRAIGPHDANLFDMRQKYAEVLPAAEALERLADHLRRT